MNIKQNKVAVKLVVDEVFLLGYLIPKALKEDKTIYISPFQKELLQQFFDENRDKPIKLDPCHNYNGNIEPQIIIDHRIPDGEYRLFSESEFQVFELENTSGTYHNHFKNNPIVGPHNYDKQEYNRIAHALSAEAFAFFKDNPIPCPGHFNCAGDYIWPGGEITRKKDL